MGGEVRARGEYRVLKLMKLKEGGGLRCLLLRRKKKIFVYIYDVIVKQKKEKRSVYHYSRASCHVTMTFLVGFVSGYRLVMCNLLLQERHQVLSSPA